MRIGYARVSTTAQNLDMQIEALNKAGCEKIYTEKESGVKERPVLKELSLQKAKDLMDKRLETGYEYYQEQSINAMCDALANIKQQDVKLAELGLCEIKYI